MAAKTPQDILNDAVAAAREQQDDTTAPEGDGTQAGDEKDEELRPEGRRALERVRQQKKALADQLEASQKAQTEMAAKLEEYEQADMTELERARAQIEKLQGDLSQESNGGRSAQQELLRLRIAAQSMLPEDQVNRLERAARRLVGDDEEALRADATEFFESFAAPAPAEKPEPKERLTRRPEEKLRGGANPEDDPGEMDPMKLAAQVRQHRTF